ncbi:MAG: tetratricopeptide repeat protein [Candidatus Krumholzibacteriaceae bacterium]
MKKAIALLFVFALIATPARARGGQQEAPAGSDSAGVDYRSAMQYLSAGNYDEAISRLRIATSLKSDYLDAWRELGGALTKIKDFRGGIDAYEKALALAPGTASCISAIAGNYLYLENWDKAEEYYTKLTDMDSLSYDGHIHLGFICRKKDDPDRAIEHYEKALASRPNDAEALERLASLYESMGKDEKRMEYLREAVEAAPGNYRLKMQLGTAYRQKKDFADAAPLFEDLVKNFPDVPAYHENLGLVLSQMSARKAEAPAELEKTLELKGSDPAVSGILARVYNELKKYDEAIAAAQKGLDAGAGHEALLCYEYGFALSKLKRYDEAIAMFEKVVATKDARWSETANKEIARLERLRKIGDSKKQQ